MSVARISFAANQTTMKLYIFKTNIQSAEKANNISHIFKHPLIKRWTIDTEDIDKVLKVETAKQLPESFIINEIQERGYACELLPY